MKFFFHYNKPESKKRGIPTITLHNKGKCLLINNVICNVPTYGKIRKQQPRFVIAGDAKNIRIINKIAHIT